MYNTCRLILQGAISAFDTKITVMGSALTSNTAAAGAGGGIYCWASVTSIDGSFFTANDAIWGGGECSHLHLVTFLADAGSHGWLRCVSLLSFHFVLENVAKLLPVFWSRPCQA